LLYARAAKAASPRLSSASPLGSRRG
jgi:hypothetical protein